MFGKKKDGINNPIQMEGLSSADLAITFIPDYSRIESFIISSY